MRIELLLLLFLFFSSSFYLDYDNTSIFVLSSIYFSLKKKIKHFLKNFFLNKKINIYFKYLYSN